MARYTITELGADGSVQKQHLAEYESDDAAIDWAGSLDHPYGIDVRLGDRLVARFPAIVCRSVFGPAPRRV